MLIVIQTNHNNNNSSNKAPSEAWAEGRAGAQEELTLQQDSAPITKTDNIYLRLMPPR